MAFTVIISCTVIILKKGSSTKVKIDHVRRPLFSVKLANLYKPLYKRPTTVIPTKYTDHIMQCVLRVVTSLTVLM